MSASASPLSSGNVLVLMLGLIYSPNDKLDFDVGIRKAVNRAEFDTAILVGATFRW